MVEEERIEEEKRYFFGPEGDKKYFIAPPTAEDIRGADWQYSKTYTQCLVEGITTSAEMVDILTRRGIIGPEFEQRANELSENLAIKIDALDSSTDPDVKRELAIEVARAREELFQWNQRLNGPMNNTAEQISDDARLEYLTSVMIVDEDNNKVWESYETYLREKSQALALRSRFEVMLYLQGLSSDFLDQTPEAIAMREVEQDILDKAEATLKAAKAVESESVLDEVDDFSPEGDDQSSKTEESKTSKKKGTKTTKRRSPSTKKENKE